MALLSADGGRFIEFNATLSRDGNTFPETIQQTLKGAEGRYLLLTEANLGFTEGTAKKKIIVEVYPRTLNGTSQPVRFEMKESQRIDLGEAGFSQIIIYAEWYVGASVEQEISATFYTSDYETQDLQATLAGQLQVRQEVGARLATRQYGEAIDPAVDISNSYSLAQGANTSSFNYEQNAIDLLPFTSYLLRQPIFHLPTAGNWASSGWIIYLTLVYYSDFNDAATRQVLLASNQYFGSSITRPTARNDEDIFLGERSIRPRIIIETYTNCNTSTSPPITDRPLVAIQLRNLNAIGAGGDVI